MVSNRYKLEKLSGSKNRIDKKPAAAYEMLEVDDKVYFDGLTAQKSIKDLKKLKTQQPFF